MALGTGVLLELLLGYRLVWRWRSVLAPLSGGLLLGGGIGLLVVHPSPGTAANLLVVAYSLFNLARISRNRLPAEQLFQVTATTGLYLAGLQLVVSAVSWWSWRHQVPGWRYALGLALLQLVNAVLMWLGARRQLRKSDFQLTKPHHRPPDSKLPSVTVAVPSRNEDAQMAGCLDAILASNYPKLEVIVFDDQSTDRTPEIIRSYAHDGVRFIGGPAPRPGWLPKNQAYNQLAKAANGELILFCGVDVRLAPDSIRQLEQLLYSRHKQMVTVLPQNSRQQAVPPLQAMRYFWEIIPPRRLFHRPPVLSSCWLVKRQLLKQAGGFEAIRHSISPESHFAQAAMASDGYSFIRSNDSLGITSQKDARDQYATAIYSRYPQLHRRPELVLLLSVLELVVIVGPLAVLAWSLIAGFGWSLAALAAAAYLLAGYVYVSATCQVFVHCSRWSAWLAFPLTFLADVAVLNISMYKYEFSQVEWHRRNVSEPIMQVIPQLPKLR